ncbi:tudor domain-containing protein [Erythrobacter sp. JK5]|uniref:tudor domain-containing protein n=1 Tax=Erythrobacter sp. JK5 TaxID=2829500 RepID=UPI001BA61423|nr:tudor domain-containing protein [Erythrobacter sp. JK5]QUL37938.1 hypothetical protein KDC96_00420 [Erythrobacter sp. JK5]
MRNSTLAAALCTGLMATAIALPAPALVQYAIGMDRDDRNQVEPREWDEGDVVFVNRKGDDWWYAAKITGRAGPDYTVQFQHGETGQASAVHIASVRLEIGDRIEIRGFGNRFVPATVGGRADLRYGLVIGPHERGKRYAMVPGSYRVTTQQLLSPPPPPPPSIENTVKVCNQNSETVHFALHYYLFDYAGFSEGLWSVAPDRCMVVDLGERRSALGFDGSYLGGTVHIYGETDGILGRAIKKSWPRNDTGVDGRARDIDRHCIGTDPDLKFAHRSGPRSPDDRIRVNSPGCVGSFQIEGMVKLRANAQGQHYYAFEGF